MIGYILQIKSHITEYIPFMLAVGGPNPSFSAVRIIEALIIAILTAFLTAFGAGYVTQQIMQNELKHLSIGQERNEKHIDKLTDVLREHIIADSGIRKP